MLNKNKWLNQKIHQKCNKIQYASKHYGDSSNDIIFKRKNPLKQRRDRKKFKTQRQRKKILKQMAFDYNDFIFHNRKENTKRIQIRPTIPYQHHDVYDLESMYYDYYQPTLYPSHHDTDTFAARKRSQIRTHMDAVIVNIERFEVQYPIQCANDDKKHNMESIHSQWDPHMHNHHDMYTQENHALQLAIAASLQPQYLPYQCNRSKVNKLNKIKFASTTIKVRGSNTDYPTHSGHQRSGLSPETIAMNTWKVYKHNAKIKDNVSFGDMKVTQQREKDCIELHAILDIYIPFMWSVYPIIFEFMGYRSLQRTKINAILPVLKHAKHQSGSKNQHHGISYRERWCYKKRRYSDYDRDVKSYIPTHVYYKTNEENKYYDIGSYRKKDWNVLSCFSRTKKRIQRGKRKPEQEYTDVYSSNVSSERLHSFHDYHSRCPCGCRRKIGARRWKRNATYRTLLSAKDCLDGERGWRWKGYGRKTPKENGWWDFHEKAVATYQWKYGTTKYVGRRRRYR